LLKIMRFVVENGFSRCSGCPKDGHILRGPIFG
jgi:hypothetical protein